VAAAEGAFDALAAQAPETATWAVAGPPAGRACAKRQPALDRLNEGVEADPWPLSEDGEVVLGKQGK